MSDFPKRSLILLVVFMISMGRVVWAQSLVKIIIPQDLYDQIQPQILQYTLDLADEGYEVSLTTGNWTDPAEVRALLQSEQGNGLIGAVLIGQIPMAQYNRFRDLNDSYWHNFYTPLYYMDLNGTWGSVESGVFTSHTGNRDPEIWVGVIRAENLPAAGNEVDLLRKYFQKVHAYRVGSHKFPRFRAFQVYYTIKPTYANLSLIYNDIRDTGCGSTASDLRQLLRSHRGFDYAVINTVSGASVHHFHQLPGWWPLPESYWVTNHAPDDIDFNDIIKDNPKILFYHLATPETGRFDMENNLSGIYVFGNDYGLGALAATQHAIIGDTYYDHLAQGETFGESFKADYQHFLNVLYARGNTSTEWCPDWDPGGGPEKLNERFYSAIYIGDPTLRIKPTNRADEIPPSISNVRATEVGIDTVVIRWDTDEPADSQVEYGLTTAYGQSSELDQTFVRSHKVVLRGLAMNTTYHYKVLSRDEAGNVAANQDYTFTTDTEKVPPQILSLQITDVTSTTARFTWQTNEPADAQVEYGGTTAYGLLSPLNAMLSTSHSITLTGLQSSVTYHARVLSSDAYGNLAQGRDTTFTTLADRTPPVIDHVQVDQITARSAQICWQTDEPSRSQVEYGTDASYGNLSPENEQPATDHCLVLENLTPQTLYHFRVRARDATGNLALGEDRSFATLADVQPPLISAINVVNVTPSSVTVQWHTNEPASAQVEYGLTDAYGQITSLDQNLSTIHAVTLTGLQPNTIYHYRVRSEDAYGNASVSGNQTFTTEPDLEGPDLFNIAIEDVTSTTARIVWQSSEPASSRLRYGSSLSYGETTPEEEQLVQLHAMELDGLSPNSTYHFQAISVDAYGNETASQDHFFMTPQAQPVFSIKLEAESMQEHNGGAAAEEGRAWRLVPGSSIANTLDFAEDDLYLFMIRLRQVDHQKTAVVDLRLDEVSQAQLRLQSESYTLFAARSFVGRGLHKISLVFAQAGDPPEGMVIDWIKITSSTKSEVDPLRISALAVDEVTDGSARISWQTNVAATAKVEFGMDRNYAFSLENAALATQHSFMLTGLADSTTYYYRISNTTDDGAQNAQDEGSFVTLFDRFPPAISKLQVNAVSADLAIIHWDSAEPSIGSIHYGLDQTYGQQTQPGAVLRKSHVDTLRNLQPNTIYHFRVEATDRRGNAGYSQDVIFQTRQNGGTQGFFLHLEAENMELKTSGSPADSGRSWELGSVGFIADSVSFPAPAEYRLAVRMKGKPLAGAWPIMELRLNGIAFTRITVGSQEFATYRTTLSALQGVHEIAFALVNPLSNNDQSRCVIVDWLELSAEGLAPDLVPPAISQIQVFNIGKSSATIAWQTDEAASGEVAYGLTASTEQYSAQRTSDTHVHIITLQGLQPDHVYYYKVIARDAAGNRSEGPVQNFRTMPAASDVDDGAAGNSHGKPLTFALSPNYPNPVQSSTQFRIALPEPGFLRAVVYDLRGREIVTLHDGPAGAGYRILRWAPDQTSGGLTITNGVYLLRAVFNGLSGHKITRTARLVVLR